MGHRGAEMGVVVYGALHRHSDRQSGWGDSGLSGICGRLCLRCHGQAALEHLGASHPVSGRDADMLARLPRLGCGSSEPASAISVIHTENSGDTNQFPQMGLTVWELW